MYVIDGKRQKNTCVLVKTEQKKKKVPLKTIYKTLVTKWLENNFFQTTS